MRLRVSHDLDKEAAQTQRNWQVLRVELWRVVRIVSFNLEARVKYAMPKDTGRATASWGHWTVKDVARRVKNNVSSLLDAVWRENPADLSIEQGSNVQYVPRLNEGWSKQAPAGFIDDLHKDHQEQLDRLVDERIDRYL